VKSKTLPRILSWIVSLVLPVALVLTAVRILLTPAFVVFEYNTPGFPADPYGFTRQQRLHWANVALEYLLNPAGISFLGDLRFQDGQSLYNERELKHMADVKNVVRKALFVWYVSLVALLGLGIWSLGDHWWPEFRRGLGRGGWLTVFLLGSIIIFVLLSFNMLFVAFHEVFFTAGTWTFQYSDTLIRLFPERFWQIAFLAIGLLSGGAGLLMGIFLSDRRFRSL
jgi:integral membrane protein (TIGR01906 family)